MATTNLHSHRGAAAPGVCSLGQSGPVGHTCDTSNRHETSHEVCPPRGPTSRISSSGQGLHSGPCRNVAYIRSIKHRRDPSRRIRALRRVLQDLEEPAPCGRHTGDLKNKGLFQMGRGFTHFQQKLPHLASRFCSRLGESPNTWKHFWPELTQEQYSGQPRTDTQCSRIVVGSPLGQQWILGQGIRWGVQVRRPFGARGRSSFCKHHMLSLQD